MGKPTTPRPVRSNPGPGVGPSNSNVPLAARSNHTRSTPKADETLAGLRTMLASANKQFETATKAIQMLERTETTKGEEVPKAMKEVSRAKQDAQRWKKMNKQQQPKYEKLQTKYEKLKAKSGKLKGEVSNLKLPQVELDSDSD
jgi:chromosome segregation ATPase